MKLKKILILLMILVLNIMNTASWATNEQTRPVTKPIEIILLVDVSATMAKNANQQFSRRKWKICVIS